MKLASTESDLYPPILRWLNGGFKRSNAYLSRSRTAMLFASNVSTAGVPDGGRWSRPDLAVISYEKARFIPAWAASIYSFEVKTYANINDDAVYEAFAHTRFVNYSYLIWQEELSLSAQSTRIVSLCSEYGIGAITFEDPLDNDTYKVRGAPKRYSLSASEFDHFVANRLKDQERASIESWLASQGWSFPNELDSFQ